MRIAGLSLSALVLLLAQVPAPDYTVRDNTLRRAAPGGYDVSVAKDLQYIGARRFHIRNSADAEQHLFVQSDQRGRVTRLVWIQIEAQLPGQSWRYNYPSPERVKLGDLDFIADARAFREYVADDTLSDHGYMDRELRDHHLSLPGPVMRLRMIYLTDAERRRELMVIYAMPLPDSTSAGISRDGVDAGKWPAELARLKMLAARDVNVKGIRGRGPGRLP